MFKMLISAAPSAVTREMFATIMFRERSGK